MPAIDIVDAHSFLNEHFEGSLIKQTTTRGRNSLRWVDIALYGLDGGTYLVHRIGQSLVYHRGDTGCLTSTSKQAGDKATVADLPDDAEPCERCNPPWPEDLADDAEIRYEFPRHTLDECSTPAEVISRLTSMRKRRARTSTRVVSEPVRELLEGAAASDPRFAEAMSGPSATVATG